jgi:hypothetical protein
MSNLNLVRCLEAFHPYIGIKPDFFIVNDEGRPINPTFAKLSNHVFIADGLKTVLSMEPTDTLQTCRALFGNSIHNNFISLHNKIGNSGKYLPLLAHRIRVSKKEREAYPTATRASKEIRNIYGLTPNRAEDSSAFLYCDGPVGLYHNGPLYSRPPLVPEVIVPLIDRILGNTCVLLDNHPDARKRRQFTGLAGDYKIIRRKGELSGEVIGIEYHTLSNFWLRRYQLFSLVMGLMRIAYCAAFYTLCRKELKLNELDKTNYLECLRNVVPDEDIIRAINNTDVELATKNFDRMLPVFHEMTKTYCVFTEPVAFKYFAARGVDHWYKEAFHLHWKDIPEGHNTGWEATFSSQALHLIKAAFAAKADTKTRKSETMFV